MNNYMYISGSESKVAGFLHQAAMEAAKKKFERLCDQYGYDAAFWEIDITLEFKTLSSNEFKPMRSIIVKDKKYE